MAKKEFTPESARRLLNNRRSDIRINNSNLDSLDEDLGFLNLEEETEELDFGLAEVTQEVISPGLSWWDKKDLKKALYTQQEKHNATGEKKYDISNIPEPVINDIYSMFYNNSNSLEFVKKTENNKWQFDLNEKLNDYLLKVVTENSSVNSFITVNEFSKMLSVLIEEEKQKNPDSSNEDCLKNVLEKAGNSKAGSNKLNNEIEKAKKKIDEKQQEVKEASGLQAGKSDNPFEFHEIDNLLDFAKMVKHLPLNHKFVANFVNQSLKFSTGYFSSSYQVIEESILDADTVDSIENCEDLLPVYKNLNLEDLMTTTRKYNLSFDIFIDNSGSMNSQYRFDGKSISGFDLCKIMALKLHNMGIVKDVYLFNDNYKKVQDIQNIFKLRTCGGTQIDRVVDYVNQTGRPAVVLTDMQDTIHSYSNKVFFIGVLDSKFSFADSGQRFATNHQCIKFNNMGQFKKQ